MYQQTINDDCYNVFPMIKDESIDLILTDPPYHISACEWDKSELDTVRLFGELRRIIKPNGTIVVFGINPFSAKIIMENIDIYRYTCVWIKPNATTPHLAKKQPMRRYEDIHIFYKNKNVYNPVMSVGKPYKWNGKRSGGEASHISYSKDIPIVNSGSRYPTNVFMFGQERGLHPTQKPVALFEYIIRLYTNELDVVLDPFMGSGTTIVACKQSNRDYICIEKDSIIYDIAMKRVCSI